MSVELIIMHDQQPVYPVVKEGISWSTKRKGTPGELTFTVVCDDKLQMEEGNRIQLKVDGKPIFLGFIFSLKRTKDSFISVTAYDQLRYLKNKDTYVYENKTATEVIQMITKDFSLETGDLEDTAYRIKSRVEENLTLLDMIENALGMTLENRKESYVLYDDFGKLVLKNIGHMVLNILLDEETGEDFDYTSSIDSDTYNKVKLTRDNQSTGKRDVYTAYDQSNMQNWGTLQYFDTLQEGEDGQAKADALLSLYNKKTRNLTLKGVFGDVRVRAGCLIRTSLNLGDTKLNHFMLVESCTHTFNNSQHTMDLTLRGGEFIA